jgi:hypothetical protein
MGARQNIWWRFRRAAPWVLAGLWNTWIDKASGESVAAFHDPGVKEGMVKQGNGIAIAPPDMRGS